MQPFVVADGMGVDSTAMLIEMARRYKAGDKSARPDLILFANVGSEWPETYRYLNEVRRPWLQKVGFPDLIVVQYKAKKATYNTLLDNCLQNATLPSLAFGFKKCSQKFKRQPQDQFCNGWEPAILAWSLGLKVIKAIGYDNGPKDSRRPHIPDDEKYTYFYPLRDVKWDRERCIEEIRKEGLAGYSKDRGGEWVETGGIPVKSACTFCPAMKPAELEVLCKDHPERAVEIITMEAGAQPYNTTVEGLWRTATKKRPGSMTEYIENNGLLSQDVIDRAKANNCVKPEVVTRRRELALVAADDCDECPGY